VRRRARSLAGPTPRRCQRNGAAWASPNRDPGDRRHRRRPLRGSRWRPRRELRRARRRLADPAGRHLTRRPRPVRRSRRIRSSQVLQTAHTTMLLSVPAGTVAFGVPATTTRCSWSGCAQTSCEPRCLMTRQPVAKSNSVPPQTPIGDRAGAARRRDQLMRLVLTSTLGRRERVWGSGLERGR
jgi:hypothetical protein